MTPLPSTGPAGTPWLIPACLLLFAVGAAPLRGQDTTVSATMLRAVAERADHYRTGRPIYLVGDRRFPHALQGPFDSRTAADRARTAAGATYQVFGPYVTARDSMADSGATVVAVRLTLRTPQGDSQMVDVDPREVDALFFTMAAVDKFLIPYYTRVFGADYAKRLRDYTLITRPKGHCASRACMPDDSTSQLINIDRPWRDGRPPADR